MKQTETIDLSGFKNGVYILRIQTNNELLIRVCQ